MRASLDTNVIIHFYRAQRQEVLFEVFDEGVFIYEQIRYIELEHHAKDLLEKIDLDILSGKIELYTDQKLKGMTESSNCSNDIYGPPCLVSSVTKENTPRV